LSLSSKAARSCSLRCRFVHFADPEAAQKAIEDVNGAQLGDSDKVVTVCEFKARDERSEGKAQFTNVYVKNLPETVTNQKELQAMFKEYGKITSAAVIQVIYVVI
jgi:polyadenylate-binding protein